MSNIHAIADTSSHQGPAFITTALKMAAALRATIHTLALRIVASIEQRFLRRRLTRLSDHMLRDLGFERDWDGSIRSLPDRS